MSCRGLSNTKDGAFCAQAMQEGITRYGCPEIFNADLGSRFTAEGFTECFRSRNTSIRVENIFI